MDGRATADGRGMRARARSDLPAEPAWHGHPRLLRTALRDIVSAGSAQKAAVLALHAAACVLAALASLAGLVGLAGSHPATSDAILDVMRDVAGGTVLDGPVADLVRDNQAAALLLVAGVVATALLSTLYLRRFRGAARPLASGGHAPPHSAALHVLACLVGCEVIVFTGLAVVATGPLAQAIGDTAGLSSDAVVAWDIVKWPVLVALAFCAFAALQRSAFRDPRVLASSSVASVQVVAALAWVVALTGFALYLASFGSFQETYGTVGSGIVLLVWLTMLSMLYYVTPDLRVAGIAALGAGAALSTATWLLTCAALAACVASLDSLDTPSAIVVVGVVLGGGLWLSNVVALLGVRLNALSIARATGDALPEPGPADEAHPPAEEERAPEYAARDEEEELAPERAPRDDAAVFSAVSRALENDVAHGGMLDPVVPGREEVPLLTDLELDLIDWGFTYGAAWALARAQDPNEPDEAVAARALAAAREVFRLYCGEDDWEERIGREVVEDREAQAGVVERHLEGRLMPAQPGHGNGHGTLHR